MKKSLMAAALLIAFGTASFAQDAAKTTTKKAPAKTDKKAPAKKMDKKSDKKTTKKAATAPAAK